MWLSFIRFIYLIIPTDGWPWESVRVRSHFAQLQDFKCPKEVFFMIARLQISKRSHFMIWRLKCPSVLPTITPRVQVLYKVQSPSVQARARPTQGIVRPKVVTFKFGLFFYFKYYIEIFFNFRYFFSFKIYFFRYKITNSNEFIVLFSDYITKINTIYWVK